jgi:hypothetical protein
MSVEKGLGRQPVALGQIVSSGRIHLRLHPHSSSSSKGLGKMTMRMMMKTKIVIGRMTL